MSSSPAAALSASCRQWRGGSDAHRAGRRWRVAMTLGHANAGNGVFMWRGVCTMAVACIVVAMMWRTA